MLQIELHSRDGLVTRVTFSDTETKESRVYKRAVRYRNKGISVKSIDRLLDYLDEEQNLASYMTHWDSPDGSHWENWHTFIIFPPHVIGGNVDGVDAMLRRKNTRRNK